jgi:hypothetical protein
MQKEQSVIRLLLLVFLTCGFNMSAQKKILGKYSFVDGTGYFFENYSFDKLGLFEYEKGGDLGVSAFGKGHYFTRNDSLILNYDLTELRVNDYHKYKYYLNNKDSIRVKINLYDLNRKPVHDTPVSIFSEKLSKKTDKDGTVEFLLKKGEKQIGFNVANIGFGYDFSIWKDRNYEIDVFLNLDNYGVPYKDQIIKYEIIELKEDYIILKSGKEILKLDKQRE